MSPDVPLDDAWLEALQVRDWLQAPPRDAMANRIDSPAVPASCRVWALNQTGAVDVRFDGDAVLLRPCCAGPNARGGREPFRSGFTFSSFPVLSPEGRNKIAQGEALGLMETKGEALKGRNLSRPFRARLRRIFSPGRCPGLPCPAPSGLPNFVVRDTFLAASSDLDDAIQARAHLPPLRRAKTLHDLLLRLPPVRVGLGHQRLALGGEAQQRPAAVRAGDGPHQAALLQRLEILGQRGASMTRRLASRVTARESCRPRRMRMGNCVESRPTATSDSSKSWVTTRAACRKERQAQSRQDSRVLGSSLRFSWSGERRRKEWQADATVASRRNVTLDTLPCTYDDRIDLA